MPDWKELLTFIDRYDLLARVLPTVLLFLPVVLPWWSLLGATVPLWLVGAVSFPMLYGLSMVVATLGRRYQTRLWARQGGAPSTQAVSLERQFDREMQEGADPRRRIRTIRDRTA